MIYVDQSFKKLNLKIWAEKSGKRSDQLPANERLFKTSDWGFGAYVRTILVDQDGQVGGGKMLICGRGGGRRIFICRRGGGGEGGEAWKRGKDI